MSGPFGSSQWMYNAGGGFYPYEIGQSLRFNDDDSAYLSRTPASAGNRKTWTFSAWVKIGATTNGSRLFSCGGDSNNRFVIQFDDASSLRMVQVDSSSITDDLRTNAKYRDPSAWYHFVFVADTTEATASDRLKIYVNGVQETSFQTSNYPALNADLDINRNTTHQIGRGVTATGYFNGYMAEVNFIDGTALDPTSFGEFKSGIWIPKAYAGSYGTNGFYLPFSDSAAIGDDLSGNTNDWTANNLVATDVLLDSPTQNWATLNPLVGFYNNLMTYLDGNLRFTQTASTGNASQMNNQGTIGMVSDKWYWEVSNFSNNNCGLSIGMDESGSHFPSIYAMYILDGTFLAAGCTAPASGASYTSSDVIGMAFDADAGTLAFYKNNVLQGTVTDIPVGNAYFSRSWVNASSDSGNGTFNFGQDSSFAGNKTAQGNTDANGRGDFYYAPPAGFLALTTANLPDPVIDPAQDDVPADYFNTVLYTGNGTTKTVSGIGFQPDLIWIKNRVRANSHVLVDPLRGFTNLLSSDRTDAESLFFGTGQYITNVVDDAFDAYTPNPGFGEINLTGDSYVAWNWLAGNGTASNTDGSITSTVSVNQKAGFSVVSYTGTAGGTQTVGHGLAAAPVFIISKNRTDAGTDWYTATGFLSGWNWNSDYFKLNTTGAKATDGGGTVFPVAPTSTVFTIGDAATNSSGKNYIAYCFHSVEGYSKFGSYTGNGSTDGPFVYCGFRPAWVMVKRTDSTDDWVILDTKRDPSNLTIRSLFPNSSSSETANGFYDSDILSNGLKVRSSNAVVNASGGTYIFACFAEQPFKFSNAR